MRIRKHAKISPLFYSTSPLSSDSRLQTHVCQLNQSPWDVMTFPTLDSSSLPYQVDGDVSFTGKGSFGDSMGAVESVASMKILMEGEENNNNDMKCCVISESGEHRENQQIGLDEGEEDTVYCCKTDGKGWQCGREVKEGNTMCEHHLDQLKNYAVLAGKKSVDTRRRPRAKKPSSAVNPHEFYYYSGFGPLWGKKRGPGRAVNSKTTNTITRIHDLGTSINNGVQVEESKRVESAAIRSEVDNLEKFDYSDEYEDDDEEEENTENGKKRARKPIKARSLKSLM